MAIAIERDLNLYVSEITVRAPVSMNSPTNDNEASYIAIYSNLRVFSNSNQLYVL